MTHVKYKNCSTFHKKQVGQYSKEIGVFKCQKFYLLVTLFSFVLPLSLFTIYIIYIFYI